MFFFINQNINILYFFFFSSRRRHTRLQGDWSSDVCSSDLIELMLNAVKLAFVAFSQARGKLDGQIFVLFVIVVAAAEAAVGLGIIIMTARNRRSLNVERVDLLKL